MRFSALLAVALSFASVAVSTPTKIDTEAPVALEKRATTKINGNKVSVVAGIIITNHITQCFQNSGVEIAKAYAAAIADQFTAYQNANHGTFWIQKIEAQWASGSTATLYCSTFDATYTFTTNYGAQVFANYVRGLMGTSKKRDNVLAGLTPDVYVSGVDLPEDHPVFGNVNTTTVDVSQFGKRNWGSCSNSKCSFSFSSDQTGRCRDTSFPSPNSYYC